MRDCYFTGLIVTDDPEGPQLKEGVAVYHIVGESNFVSKRMHELHALVKKGHRDTGKTVSMNGKDRVDIAIVQPHR